MITTEDVRAAYRLILGRNPENEEVLLRHSREAHSLADLRKRLLSSAEFRSDPSASASQRPLNWPPIEVEVDTSDRQLSAMIKHIEVNWHALGLSDPHWSVLSQKAFRAANIANTEEQFYESGKPDVEKLQRT